MKNNRRDFIKKSTGIAAAIVAAAAVPGLSAGSQQTILKDVQWPVLEGPNTPKISIGCGRDEQSMKTTKQMGVDYVQSGGGRIPWTVDVLREIQNAYRAHGLEVINMYIAGYPNTIYGKPGRDEEIEMVKQSIIATGTVGIPIIEWNFYLENQLMEAYFYKEGRGGSGVTAVDYYRLIGDTMVKDLPPSPGIDKYSAEQLWSNITYFINAVIPVAEKAGVRMAIHPNDPPPAINKGNPQIIRGFDGWKRLLDIAKTPFHGMTFDPGVSYEMGLNPIEVMRMMGDQMNYSHYRNVITYEPYHKYDEVFFDVGQVNMFAVMKEYFNMGYNLYIYPEHQRFFTRDATETGQTRIGGYPGGGGISGLIWNVAYTRAMMQAAMSTI